jgi:hypothetical protein
MVDNKKMAQWMLDQFKNGYLYQEDIAWALNKESGFDYTYENDNGNLAISKPLLKEFKKVTEGKVVWERGEKAWRILKDNEKYRSRQQD